MVNKSKQNKFETLAKQLQAASESTRLEILCLIFTKKKACVSEIALKLKLSVASASHHLLALSKEKLLRSEREGKKICYVLEDTNFVNDLKNLICKYK